MLLSPRRRRWERGSRLRIVGGRGGACPQVVTTSPRRCGIPGADLADRGVAGFGIASGRGPGIPRAGRRGTGSLGRGRLGLPRDLTRGGKGIGVGIGSGLEADGGLGGVGRLRLGALLVGVCRWRLRLTAQLLMSLAEHVVAARLFLPIGHRCSLLPPRNIGPTGFAIYGNRERFVAVLVALSAVMASRRAGFLIFPPLASDLLP